MAQSEKDAGVVKNVRKMLDEARRDKAGHEADFDRFYKFYMGDQWEKKPPAHRSDIVMNYVFSNIETILPIMTDNRPTIDIRPRGPEDKLVAEKLGHLVDYVMDFNDMERKTPQVIRDSLIYGTGFWYVYWDQDKEDGAGEICIKVADPYGLYIDPNSGDDMEDAEYVIQVVQENVGKAKSKYPDIDWDTITSIDEDKKDHRKGLVASIIGKFRGETQQVTDSEGTETNYMEGGQKGDYGYTDKTVEVIRAFYKDYSTESYDEETGQVDEDGNPITTKGKKLVYPKGRMTIIVGGQKAFDDHNPFGFYPYVKVPDYDIAHEVWAEGEVRQEIPVQKEINKRKAKMIDHFTLETNTPWRYTDGKVNPDHISDVAGIKIPVGRGGEVSRVPIAPLSGDILASLQDSKRDMEILPGVSDITQGRRPKGVTAASAIGRLQEAGQSRIRLKTRSLEWAFKILGQKIIDLIIQNYTEPRMLRIYNEQNEQTSFENFYFQADGNKRMAVDGVNPESGEQLTHEVGKFDVKVKSGSTLPVEKDAQMDLALTLFKMGAIDRRALLDATDFQGKEDVINRMEGAAQDAMKGGMKAAKDDPEVKAKEQELLQMGVSPEEIAAAQAGGG